MVLEAYTLLVISNEQHGGYNTTDQDIGFCYLIVGVAEILFQFLLYSKLVTLLGLRKLLLAAFITFTVATFLFPWGSSIPIAHSNFTVLPTDEWTLLNETTVSCGYNVTKVSGNFIQRRPALEWFIVIVLFMALLVASIASLLTSSIVLSNAAPSKIRGTVNGIGISLVSLFRAIGYVSTAMIFAWSQNNGKDWPLNCHFIFILLAAMLLCSMPLICSLSKSVEKKKS